MTTYALVSDCTPNNGTIEAISTDVGEMIDVHESRGDDTWRAIRVNDSVSVGDRIGIDWDTEQVNLAECL